MKKRSKLIPPTTSFATKFPYQEPSSKGLKANLKQLSVNLLPGGKEKLRRTETLRLAFKSMGRAGSFPFVQTMIRGFTGNAKFCFQNLLTRRVQMRVCGRLSCRHDRNYHYRGTGGCRSTLCMCWWFKEPVYLFHLNFIRWITELIQNTFI